MTTAKVCINRSWTNELENNTDMVSSKLSKHAQSVAKTELGEDEKTREEALREMRDWVVKNKGLIDVRTDDVFLLRFLRFKKFSVAQAEYTLVKYLNLRRSLPQYALKLDCDEAKVAELIHSGYLFPSPVRDSLGRRVIIGIASKLDISKFTNVHMSKVHQITYEALLEDEENQVCGVRHFGDLQGITVGHLGLFSPVEFALVMRVGEQAFPMRHKSVHFINMNYAFKYAYDFFSSRFTEKIRNRLLVHDSLDDLHQHLEAKCLPKEYGGDIPMADMIVSWQKELTQHKQMILKIDSMKSLIPIRRRNQTQQIEELRGSFRKLEFD